MVIIHRLRRVVADTLFIVIASSITFQGDLTGGASRLSELFLPLARLFATPETMAVAVSYHAPLIKLIPLDVQASYKCINYFGCRRVYLEVVSVQLSIQQAAVEPVISPEF